MTITYRVNRLGKNGAPIDYMDFHTEREAIKYMNTVEKVWVATDRYITTRDNKTFRAWDKNDKYTWPRIYLMLDLHVEM